MALWLGGTDRGKRKREQTNATDTKCEAVEKWHTTRTLAPLRISQQTQHKFLWNTAPAMLLSFYVTGQKQQKTIQIPENTFKEEEQLVVNFPKCC